MQCQNICFFKRELCKGQNHNWKTTTFTKIFVLANVPQIYIYTSSSLKATMRCEVTRAGSKTTTRVARSHIHSKDLKVVDGLSERRLPEICERHENRHSRFFRKRKIQNLKSKVNFLISFIFFCQHVPALRFFSAVASSATITCGKYFKRRIFFTSTWN